MENEMTAKDWEDLTKIMYSQMKHRPDHKKIVKRILKEAVATKIEIESPGNCSVYVQLPDGWWGEWVDVWISNEDVRYDWNNMYMDDITNDSDVFDAAMEEALRYAISQGVIIETEDGYRAA